MKISKSAQVIEPALTRQLFNYSKKFENVIDLTLGDPDISPSKCIMDAASKAILEGKIRYSANAGLIDLRKSISNVTKKEYGIDVNPENEIIITVGGMEALYLSLFSILDEGDEVIVLGPYYVNYVQMIKMCGAVPIIVNSYEKDKFAVNPEQIAKSITDKTVAIIVNTPCNPTGAVLPRDVLDKIADIAIKNDLYVIADEVYRTLIFDGKKHESIITCDNMKSRTILIDSVSKRFAMTGYRVGYIIAPPELIERMILAQENVVACAPLPSQYAAIEAYEACQDDTYIRDEFEKRRDYMVDAINKLDKLSCVKPDATFYIYVNISETGLDCFDFAYKLIDAVQVAVVPGTAFGSEYKDYIRIALTMPVDKLSVAVERIGEFVASI